MPDLGRRGPRPPPPRPAAVGGGRCVRRRGLGVALLLGGLAAGGPGLARAADAPAPGPAVPPAAPAAPDAPVRLEDFDETATGTWTLTDVEVVEHGAAGDAETWLDATPTSPRGGRLERRFAAPEDWRRFHRLELRASVPSGPPRPMRVHLPTGRDAHRGGFVRRFTLAPGTTTTVLRLADFRDDGARVVGRFDAVRGIRLQFDDLPDAPPGPLPPVRLDALTLVPGPGGGRACDPTPAERLAVAFPAGGVVHEGRRFVLLTDAPALAGDDGKRLVARLDAVADTAASAYGVPVPDGVRAAFHVAADRAGYVACVARHAAHFAVQVAPPRSDGFTVMRRGFSAWDPAQGIERPVYVHEAAHAWLAEATGLACDGNWVHEGFATAMQARFHPASVRGAFGDAMRALARGERSPFPRFHDGLGAERPALVLYPMLGTVVDFLASEHRDAMPKVWAAYAAATGPFHRVKAEPAAEVLGTTPAALEAAWLAWGDRRWPPASPPPGTPPPGTPQPGEPPPGTPGPAMGG